MLPKIHHFLTKFAILTIATTVYADFAIDRKRNDENKPTANINNGIDYNNYNNYNNYYEDLLRANNDDEVIPQHTEYANPIVSGNIGPPVSATETQAGNSDTKSQASVENSAMIDASELEESHNPPEIGLDAFFSVEIDPPLAPRRIKKKPRLGPKMYAKPIVHSVSRFRQKKYPKPSGHIASSYRQKKYPKPSGNIASSYRHKKYPKPSGHIASSYRHKKYPKPSSHMTPRHRQKKYTKPKSSETMAAPVRIRSAKHNGGRKRPFSRKYFRNKKFSYPSKKKIYHQPRPKNVSKPIPMSSIQIHHKIPFSHPQLPVPLSSLPLPSLPLPSLPTPQMSANFLHKNPIPTRLEKIIMLLTSDRLFNFHKYFEPIAQPLRSNINFPSILPESPIPFQMIKPELKQKHFLTSHISPAIGQLPAISGTHSYPVAAETAAAPPPPPPLPVSAEILHEAASAPAPQLTQSRKLTEKPISKFQSFPSLPSSFGGLAKLFGKSSNHEHVRRDSKATFPLTTSAAPEAREGIAVAESRDVEPRLALQPPAMIVRAYHLQRGPFHGHVVIEDFPYGRAQIGQFDEGAAPSLGCAQLDSAIPDTAAIGKY